MMNYPDNIRDNIFVLLRLRPLSDKEIREGATVCVRKDENRENTVILENIPEPKSFSYDWVTSDSDSQEEIFNNIGRSMVDTCLQGRLDFGFFRRGCFSPSNCSTLRAFVSCRGSLTP
jgi:hypothetical protein